MNKKIQCPTCAKEIVWSSKEPSRPFCSERCKLIDLGEWANESHCIPGEPAFIENSDDLEKDFKL